MVKGSPSSTNKKSRDKTKNIDKITASNVQLGSNGRGKKSFNDKGAENATLKEITGNVSSANATMTESRDSITVINNDSDNKDSQKDVLATTDGQGNSKGNEEDKKNSGETKEAEELADSERIEEAGEGEELATEEHPKNSKRNYSKVG